jgi:DNA-directed RNA polymerase specialized sigma24 family protein
MATMPHPTPPDADGFHTTRWSLIRSSTDSPEERHQALEWLCRDYWQPLFRHARHRGLDHEDALDATQGFFARILAGEPFDRVAEERGRFRAWMLAAMNHYLADLQKHDSAQKRGGAIPNLSLDELVARDTAWEPVASTLTPDQEFDRNWALSVMEKAMTGLAEEYAKRGSSEQFTLLSPFLATRPDQRAYTQIADKTGTTSNSVAVAVKRLRDRFRERIRAAARETVGSEEEVESEMALLFAALRG